MIQKKFLNWYIALFSCVCNTFFYPKFKIKKGGGGLHVIHELWAVDSEIFVDETLLAFLLGKFVEFHPLSTPGKHLIYNLKIYLEKVLPRIAPMVYIFLFVVVLLGRILCFRLIIRPI